MLFIPSTFNYLHNFISEQILFNSTKLLYQLEYFINHYPKQIIIQITIFIIVLFVQLTILSFLIVFEINLIFI